MIEVSFPAVNKITAYDEEFIRVRQDVMEQLAERAGIFGFVVGYGKAKGNSFPMTTYTFRGRPIAITRYAKGKGMFRYLNASLLLEARSRGYNW